MAFTSLAGEQVILDDAAASPIAEVVELGTSTEGRTIRAVAFGPNRDPDGTDTRADLVLTGCVHGNEPAGREAQLAQIEAWLDSPPAFLDTLTVVIIPTVNPDGFAINNRENANEVDLNRGWLALSQPETRAVAALLGQRRPLLLLDQHEFWGPGREVIGDQDITFAHSQMHNADAAIIDLGETLRDHLITQATGRGYASDVFATARRALILLDQQAPSRHGVGMIAESRWGGQDPPSEQDRISAHMGAIDDVIEWLTENLGTLSDVSAAQRNRQAELGEQRVAFNLYNAPPLAPPPLGYRLSPAQIEQTARHRAAFNIEMDGDVVWMGQEARLAIAPLLDPLSVDRIVPATPLRSDDDPEPPGPDEPQGEALPAGTFSPVVTWYGCDLLTGRIIAELPEVTGNIGRLLGAYTSANLSTPIPSGVLAKLAVQATVPMRTMIVAVVNGQPCWAGIVLTRQRGTGATMDLATATPEVYLNRRIVRDHNWRGRDEASVIAGGLVADAGDIPGVGPGIGLEIDAPPTGRSRDREYAAMDRATVYDRLRELMGVRNGPEFTIEPMWGDGEHTRVRLVVRIRSRIGVASTQPRAVFESAGASSAEYVLTEDYSDGRGATYVVASSSGEGEDKPTSAPAIATTMLDAGWPIVERHFEPGSNISSIATLNEHAENELDLLAHGASTWEISARWNVYPSLNIDWRIGDDIAWNLTGHGHPEGTQGTGRCIGWELRPSEGTVSPILLNPQEGAV